MRESYRDVRGWIARINAFLQENITGMATVQLFRREALQLRAVRRRSTAGTATPTSSRSSTTRCSTRRSKSSARSPSALIIWYGGASVLRGTLTLGALVAFLQYSQRFFRPISDMSEKFNMLQAAMASSERIFALLDEPVVIRSPAAPVRPRRGRRAHRVRGRVVRVRPRARFAVRRARLGAARRQSSRSSPGERVGIVGATGAGKTTLINLLLRFYDVQRGGSPSTASTSASWTWRELRGLFSLVLQDVHLFSGTIADNIRLGQRGDRRRARAARGAGRARRRVHRAAAGRATTTPVAERGATLSVGQKQLLSFARALAFDPRVLILDEATSSVDTETELLIRDALHVLMAGRTTIAIAHRLSTIQDMDQILVLHKGELRERARTRSCWPSAASTSGCTSCSTRTGTVGRRQSERRQSRPSVRSAERRR